MKELHNIIVSESFWTTVLKLNIAQYLITDTKEDIYTIHNINNQIYTTTKDRKDYIKYKYGLSSLWYEDVQKQYGYKTKPGRLFRVLNTSLTDKQIEEITHLWNTYFAGKTANIVIWKSDKIPYAYLYHNYTEGGGTLQNSCMRYKEKQPLLKFYQINNIDIIVLLSDDKIAARALLWPPMLFKTWGGKYRMMDRKYYTNEEDKDLLNKFALDNGFVIRCDNEGFVKSLGESSISERVYLNNINMDGILCLPYADTMYELFFKDKILCNRFMYNNTSGIKDLLKYPNSLITMHTLETYIEILDPDIIIEVFTSKKINSKDAVLSNRYDGYVNKNNIVFIGNDLDGYHKLDPLICKLYSCNYELKSKCVESNEFKCFIRKTEALILSEIIVDSSLKIVDKDWIDADIIKSKNKEIIKLNTGEYVLKNDVNTKYLTKDKQGSYVASLTPIIIKSIPDYQSQFKIVTRNGITKFKEHFVDGDKEPKTISIELDTSNMCSKEFCHVCEYNTIGTDKKTEYCKIMNNWNNLTNGKKEKKS